VGMPEGWRLFVDSSLTAMPTVVIGSGVRRSKLVLPGLLLPALPRAEVVEGLGRPAPS
jgi:prolyl-tRNA editing enzyme YbaK/EbsC (Cys-tRNA(Pro) deacylase)